MFVSRNHDSKQNKYILLVLFLAVVVVKRSDGGTIIAKSDLTVCDDFDNNPHNVVDNKPCKKKLIVTQSVLSGQEGGESLLFTTNTVHDQLEKEDGRLYNPFILKISKSAANLVYPFYYELTVNNKPFEEIVTERDCSAAHYSPDPTCGFTYENGLKVWDSQGFCCRCARQDSVPKWLRVLFHGGHLKRHYRGGQGGLCGYRNKHGKNDFYSHCMRHDQLWYDVYSIGNYRVSFVIDIQAYDQVTRNINNQTVTEWVDGGKIELSFRKKSAVGQYGRLRATFHGTYTSTEELQTFKDHYFLLIPQTKNVVDANHAQILNGFHDYMIIPADKISLDPQSHESCDKIGVSHSSFRKLGGGQGAVGPGCEQKINSCFDNQPKDFFESDTVLRSASKRPEYFVERYGNCVGVNKEGPSETLGIVYRLSTTVTSLLTLEVSADDMIIIYNRASGTIIKSFASNFDALSRDGKMTVMVQNTGLVTSNFYVVISACSEGVHLNEERTATINPKAIKTFDYSLEVYHRRGKRHYCSVQLYDSRRHLQDSKNVSFKTYSPCVCLEHCSCQCSEVAADENDLKLAEEGNLCSEPNDHDDDEIDDEDEEKSEKSILDKILNTLLNVVDKRILFLIGLFFFGIVKAVLGRQSLAIAKLGWGGIRTGEKITRKINGREIELVFNGAMDLVDPETEKTIIPNNPDWDFYRNLVFFILLPIILVINVGLIVWKLKLKSGKEQLPVLNTSPQKPTAGPETSAPKSKRIIPKTALNVMKKNRFGFTNFMTNTPKLKKSAPKK